MFFKRGLLPSRFRDIVFPGTDRTSRGVFEPVGLDAVGGGFRLAQPGGRKRPDPRKLHRRLPSRGRKRSVAPPHSLHAQGQLDERSQRARLPQGRVPPFLPVQPEGGGLGEHVVGARRLQRPRALERTGSRHTRNRPVRRLLRIRRRRRPQHVGIRDSGQSPHGRDLDAQRQCERHPIAIAGLFHGQRPNVEPSQRRSPRLGRQVEELPRPQGFLGREGETLDDGLGQGRRAQGLFLFLAQPEGLEV